jgi:hypothetical protein
MLKNLITKGLKTAAFAILGNVAAAFLAGLTVHQPTGLDTLSGYAWPAVAAAVAGGLAALKRLVQWDPKRG